MQRYVFIDGMERPPWRSVPGRLAQPALLLQKIAAFGSLADNLRSEGHLCVKFLEGHRGLRVCQGAQKWPTTSVLTSRRKGMATRTRMQDSLRTSSFKAFRHAITKCSEAILNEVTALKLKVMYACKSDP